MNDIQKLRVLFEQGVFEIGEGRIGPGTFLRRIQDELQEILINTFDDGISNAAIEAKTTLSDLEQNAAMDEINRITARLAALADNFAAAAHEAENAAASLPSDVITGAAQDVYDLITKAKETAMEAKTEFENEAGILGKVSVMLRHLEEIEAEQGS